MAKESLGDRSAENGISELSVLPFCDRRRGAVKLPQANETPCPGVPRSLVPGLCCVALPCP